MALAASTLASRLPATRPLPRPAPAVRAVATAAARHGLHRAAAPPRRRFLPAPAAPQAMLPPLRGGRAASVVTASLRGYVQRRALQLG